MTLQAMFVRPRLFTYFGTIKLMFGSVFCLYVRHKNLLILHDIGKKGPFTEYLKIHCGHTRGLKINGQVIGP